MNLLTIIYSLDIDNLLKFKDKATHWLPETNQPSMTSNSAHSDIYHPPNVICTTKPTSLELIKSLIDSSQLDYSKVIWINASDPDETIAYLFNSRGNINDFFKI